MPAYARKANEALMIKRNLTPSIIGKLQRQGKPVLNLILLKSAEVGNTF
jgi:hypothetical protein